MTEQEQDSPAGGDDDDSPDEGLAELLKDSGRATKG